MKAWIQARAQVSASAGAKAVFGYFFDGYQVHNDAQ